MKTETQMAYDKAQAYRAEMEPLARQVVDLLAGAGLTVGEARAFLASETLENCLCAQPLTSRE